MKILQDLMQLEASMPKDFKFKVTVELIEVHINNTESITKTDHFDHKISAHNEADAVHDFKEIVSVLKDVVEKQVAI